MSGPVNVLAVMAPAPHQITKPGDWKYVRRTVQPVEQEGEFGAADGEPKATKLQECRIFEQVFAYLDTGGKDPPPQAIVDATKLEAARAAVAELIEAASAVAIHEGASYCQEWIRLESALARVKGVRS